MSGTTTAAAALRRRAAGAGANRWVVLVVLCVSLLLVALDATVLHVAVPAVTEDLRPGAIELLWIVDVYPLVCASLLILFGTLGDRVGRRRVLLLGYAPLRRRLRRSPPSPTTPQVLIAARALLGVGGAMIMPATLSILRQVFPDRRERALADRHLERGRRGRRRGRPAARRLPARALLVGLGLPHQHPADGWSACRSGRWLLPESRGDGDGPWDVRRRADGRGRTVRRRPRREAARRRRAALRRVDPGCRCCAGAALLVLFVRRQRRRTHPLIDLRMFARPAFSTSVGCIVLAMLALVGLELIAAQYLQLVLGLSPLETGLRLLPLTFAAMAAGLAGSQHAAALRAARGWSRSASASPRWRCWCSPAMGATGQHGPAAVRGFVLLGFGLETTLFGAYESMLSEAPPAQAGGAAAIGETSYQLGRGHRHRAARQRHERGLRARALVGARGVPAAASGARGTRWARRTRSPRGSAGRPGAALRGRGPGLLRARAACDACWSARGCCCSGAVMALRLPRAMECGAPAAPPEPEPRVPAPRGGAGVPAESVPLTAAAAVAGADAAPSPRRAGLWTCGTLRRNVSASRS